MQIPRFAAAQVCFSNVTACRFLGFLRRASLFQQGATLYSWATYAAPTLWASYAAQVCITSVCHAHSNARIIFIPGALLAASTRSNQFFSFARRVKGYTRLVGKYLTEEGSVSYPIKPNPPSNVRLSVRPSVRLSGW